MRLSEKLAPGRSLGDHSCQMLTHKRGRVTSESRDQSKRYPSLRHVDRRITDSAASDSCTELARTPEDRDIEVERLTKVSCYGKSDVTSGSGTTPPFGYRTVASALRSQAADVWRQP